MLDLTCKSEDLDKASKIVRDGGVVGYPTDTVYGIGCNPFDGAAVSRVFQIKQRRGKPLPVLCESLDSAAQLVYLNRKATKLGRHFWPGALTIVAPVKELRFPTELTGGKDTLAVRVPGNSCARSLIRKCGGSLVGTSANISGSGSPITAEQIRRSLIGIDALIDSGDATGEGESTIVEVNDETVIVLRQGAVPRKELIDYF